MALAEALADDRVDGTFDEASGDALSITPPFRVVRDHVLVVGDIRIELCRRFAKRLDGVCYGWGQNDTPISPCDRNFILKAGA